MRVTSNSSIPDKNSTIESTMSPQIKSYLFRGGDPTIIKILAMPSAYESEISSLDSGKTGYHIMYADGTHLGTSYSYEDVMFVRDLYVNVEFSLSESALLT